MHLGPDRNIGWRPLWWNHGRLRPPTRSISARASKQNYTECLGVQSKDHLGKCEAVLQELQRTVNKKGPYQPHRATLAENWVGYFGPHWFHFGKCWGNFSYSRAISAIVVRANWVPTVVKKKFGVRIGQVGAKTARYFKSHFSPTNYRRPTTGLIWLWNSCIGHPHVELF